MEHQLTDNRSTRQLLTAPLRVLLLVLLGTGSALAQSPTYSFAIGIGSTGLDRGNAIATDASGNSYVTGLFEGTVDFDPGAGTSNLTTTGRDMFLAKYDASGNYLWAFSVGGGSEGTALGVDGSGNVVVTGPFRGTVDFDPGAGTSNLTAPNWTSTFVAKYSPTGNYLWGFALQGAGIVTPSALALDGSGNVMVTGNFSYSVDFDPGPGNASLNAANAGDASIFIAKYSPTGAYSWAFTIKGGNGPGNAGNSARSNSLATDGSGNIVVTGNFNCTLNFNPSGKGSLTATSSGALFVARYSAAGKYSWAFQGGNVGGKVATDGSGNIYIAGGFQGTVDFNPGSATANLTSAGDADLFLARYTSAGAYSWAFRIGGTGSDGSSAIDIDGSGDVYVTGSFRGTVDFDPGAATSMLTSTGTGSNMFVARYTSSGSYLWAFNIDGLGSSASIATDGNSNIYVTGLVRGTVDFDPGEGTAYLTSTGGPTDMNYDMFVAVYSQPTQPKRSSEAVLNDQQNTIQLRTAPNPFTSAFTIGCDGITESSRIQIIDMMGQVVEAIDVADPIGEINLGSELPAGTYFVQVTHGEESRTMLVHKVR